MIRSPFVTLRGNDSGDLMNTRQTETGHNEPVPSAYSRIGRSYCTVFCWSRCGSVSNLPSSFTNSKSVPVPA